MYTCIYVHMYIWIYKFKRKKKDVFDRMLEHFLEETKKNKMYGEWNDQGRLIDY